ncbi:MAG: LuxR C-terminal-related transcriptional regulator [Pseudomonadota bacterium]
MASPDSVRILALDDEDLILRLYDHALCGEEAIKAAGFPLTVALTCCRSGKEAFTALERSRQLDTPFAVVFLDLGLGRAESGIDVGARIREMDPLVNIVVVTGMTETAPETIARRIAPADKLLYLQKPFHAFEIQQFASALSAKWHSERMLQRSNAALAEKNLALEESRETLLNQQRQLERMNNQLLETNDALSVLARNLERARKESEKQILHRTRTLILPIVERILAGSGMEKHHSDLELLKSYVMNLFPGHTEDLKMAARLSATESRIAAMIRNGMSTEDIAKNLYISTNTVKTHRKNIRRKLDLQNSGFNLRAWLGRKA